ncbi:MAG: hypothetical protein AAFO07_20100 [Bacteroidota bacterium]
MAKKTLILSLLISISFSCNQNKLSKRTSEGGNTLIVRILPKKKLEIYEQQYNKEGAVTKVEKFVKRNIESNQVLIRVGVGADYHFYLEVSNLIREIYYDERNQESLDRFGKKFDDLEKPKQEELKKEIPLNLKIEYEKK